MAGLTTLNEDLDNSETGVDITPSVTAASRPALIMVDDEVMAVSAGTSSLTVVRASEGTSAATHTNTTVVYEVLKIDRRADSLLIYYYKDGSVQMRRIVITGDTTATLPNPFGKADGSVVVISSNAYAIETPDIAPVGGGSLYTVQGHITEAGAGTYTMSWPVKAGQSLLDIVWYTDTAFGAATSATLEAGVTGTLAGFMTGVNCKAQGAGDTNSGVGTLWGTANAGILAGAKSGYVFPTDTNLIVTVVTVGAGTTGRFRARVLLSSVLPLLEATKT